MIPVVYDHPDFLVVNKPVGVSMHIEQKSTKTELGLADKLCEQQGLKQLFLVHRLDTHTSGVMVLAKNKTTAARLSKQFELRHTTKFYLALLAKKPKKKQGKIQGMMEKARNGSYKLVANSARNSTNETPKAKDTKQSSPAVTLFISKPYNINTPANALTPPNRIAIIKPITGKTHQIRVALKALGSPILGDKRYKGGESDRLYLHSTQLEFSLCDEVFNFKCLPEQGQFFDSTLLNQLPNFDSMPWPSYQLPQTISPNH